jgi:hypothetical protein
MKLTRKIEKTFRLDTYTSGAALRNLNRIQWILRNGSADTGTFLRTWLNRELRQQWHARGQAQKIDYILAAGTRSNKLRHVGAALSLVASFSAVSQAQTVANLPSIGFVSNASTPADSLGIRPAHLWSVDYVKLLWSDTGAVLTAPAHWNEMDWMCAGFAAAGIGAAASLDNAIKDNVQAHRTAGQDRFLNQYQNLGAAWSFGVIGAFEIWGEAGSNTTAKDTAMDALTASIIGPGLIGTSLKYAVGRVRPNTASNAFEFKPFSNNQSFPSGHASQAFAVATAIAENYPVWWVQTLCYGGAGLVGYARIEQNAHYASDVVAGALLGWAVARTVVHRHIAPPNPEKLNWSLCADGDGARLVFFKSF